MLKVLIIEDEQPAIDKLSKLLMDYDPDTKILGALKSVSESVKWFESNHDAPDLIFMDIRLTDGTSFEIFNQIELTIPVIFITAYDAYALKAFEVNSIDYLLKPLQYDDLYKSLEKLKSMRESLPGKREAFQYNEINQLIESLRKDYKTRFLVKIGDHIKSVRTESISLFYAEGRIVYLLTSKGNKYIVDYTLEDLISQLDPNLFFRVNRSFIININAIDDVVVYSKSRLKIELNQKIDKEVIVSREKVNALKTWFEGLQ